MGIELDDPVDYSTDTRMISHKRDFAICLVLRAIVELSSQEERKALRTLVFQMFDDPEYKHAHNERVGCAVLRDVLKMCGLGPED